MSGPTKEEWKARALAAEAHAERMNDLVDPELSFKDLEVKMRDGAWNLRAVLGEGSRPATRFLAAVMLHAILGDHDGPPSEPPNYQATTVEMDLCPAGQFQPIRCSMEVIKPGGKSSHEIREQMEAELARLRPPTPSGEGENNHG